MRPRRAPASAARSTLRRLRWVLAALFTVVNTLGLVILAYLVIRSDADRGRRQLDGEAQHVTLAVIQLLRSSGGAVSFDELTGSGLERECPGFAVLSGGARPFLGVQSPHRCPSASLVDLNRTATRAVGADRVVAADGTADGSAGGRPVRMLAEPFAVDRSVAGAVVATVDASSVRSEHDRVVAATVTGCAVLVVGLAVAGYLLAGRAMRPAANTLEQQELLLAEAAHDLRTPLAGLRALAETALQNPGQRAELLPRTVELSRRMGGIIDDLLTRARLAAGVAELNRQPVRLDQLAAGVVEDTPPGDARITLRLRESVVVADPTLIQRAIGNLLDNALRYGRTPDEPASVTVAVAEGWVVVADRGPGLQEAVAAAPFERSGASTGLGLSIVRWIAEAHGGRLHAHNDPAGGAVFQLQIRGDDHADGPPPAGPSA